MGWKRRPLRAACTYLPSLSRREGSRSLQNMRANMLSGTLARVAKVVVWNVPPPRSVRTGPSACWVCEFLLQRGSASRPDRFWKGPGPNRTFSAFAKNTTFRFEYRIERGRGPGLTLNFFEITRSAPYAQQQTYVPTGSLYSKSSSST